jgi:hypothetical protein
VSYDWSRLETNLVSEGILEKRPLGNGELMHYRADQLLDHWTEKLREDELYLLTPDSKGEVGVLFEKYGYPLTFENVEGTT